MADITIPEGFFMLRKLIHPHTAKHGFFIFTFTLFRLILRFINFAHPLRRFFQKPSAWKTIHIRLSKNDTYPPFDIKANINFPIRRPHIPLPDPVS